MRLLPTSDDALVTLSPVVLRFPGRETVRVPPGSSASLYTPNTRALVPATNIVKPKSTQPSHPTGDCLTQTIGV